MRPRRWLTALFPVLTAGVSLGQGFPNWPTPSSWTPPADELAKPVLSPPLPFAPITPCRVVDTRPSQGFSGAYGPPIMSANATRTFPIAIAPHCPDIPDAAAAYSVNITVTETVGPGDIRVWPAGNPPLVVSTQNWAAAGATLANAAIVPAGTSGSITVQIAGSDTHLIIDVNGVFYKDLIPTHQLTIISDSAGAAAILGVNTSAAAGSHGVGGFANGGVVHGVQGQVGPAAANGSSGVRGINDSTAGTAVGVLGEVTSPASGASSAGVRGTNASTGANGTGVFGSHGGFGIGVQGESISGEGVLGQAGIPGGIGGWGVHGIGYGGGNNGVRGTSFADGVGVFFEGGLAGTGTKAFIEPHPTDPALAIKYVSLEGPEAGTYFRGRSRFSNGLARIPVPETFRMVTADEGLSIQVTAIGEMATIAVVRMDLNEIVVKGSRNVEFFYMVNGVRRAYPDWDPVTSSEMAFRPRTPDARLPENLSEDERQRLIANGTYTPEGKVNRKTAKKLGWDRSWKERERRR